MDGRPGNRGRAAGARRTRHSRGAARRADLSQHFLRSDSTAKRLVAASTITRQDLVIEAGPGDGALTAHLAAIASRVVAIELDRTLYSRLQTRFADTANVTLRNSDFLSYSLPSGAYSFFANIPYARTAAIVRKLVLGSRPPEAACLIMEAASASRFLGQPFGPESVFSLMLKARFEPSLIAWLDPREFSPPPSVNSVMLKLMRRAQPLFKQDQLREFDRFARSVFNSSHRSTRSLLRSLLSGPQTRSLINELGFPESAPPSNIAFENWLTVFKLAEWNRNA